MTEELTFGSMASMVVFKDVQAALDDIISDSNSPISSSPHGKFWEGVSRNDFVGKNVNMVDPLKSTFYVYLDTGVMPLGGPHANTAHPKSMAVIKQWLSTGFH